MVTMVTLSPAFLSGQTMDDVNPLSQNLSQLPPAFAGSVPAGKASGTVLELSLHDALDLSLKQNLKAPRISAAPRLHACAP